MKFETTMNRQAYMVPMTPFCLSGGAASGGYAFALYESGFSVSSALLIVLSCMAPV